jgi:hypothetical protein
VAAGGHEHIHLGRVPFELEAVGPEGEPIYHPGREEDPFTGTSLGLPGRLPLHQFDQSRLFVGQMERGCDRMEDSDPRIADQAGDLSANVLPLTFMENSPPRCEFRQILEGARDPHLHRGTGGTASGAWTTRDMPVRSRQPEPP